VALYPRNFNSPASLRTLTEEIRAAASGPVIIGMDQEGGTKFSLPEPFTQWPSPAQLGAIGDSMLVRHIAEAMARELRAVGVNLNFAPMLDLHINPESPVTRGRSFGANPQHVATLGMAFIEGLWKKGGVLACAKHFPGHGDAQLDPHEELPVCHGDAQRLERRELVPFAAAIDTGVSAIMTAHILLPQIDPSQPASFSSYLLRNVLRERMGFEGVVLADDLGMGAVRKRFRADKAAVAALQAGSDIVMLCHDGKLIPPALSSVRVALQNELFRHEEWHRSGQRIRVTLESAAHRASIAQSESPDAIGCDEHRALAQQAQHLLKEKVAPPGR
jgi:beta-N-acetylhexosaminidase